MSETTYNQNKIDKLLLANLKLSKSLETIIDEILNGGEVDDEDLNKIATASKLGLIKVDGQSILIDENGTISINPENVGNGGFTIGEEEEIKR